MKGTEKAVHITRGILFDIAYTVGKMDARNFHEKMNLHDPIEKLSAGPIHFSHSGWAFVDIFPESTPSPDENYCLVYDHPFSFESDAWIRAGKAATFPVCVMNAGYSSGWCEASFGIELTAVEIACRAHVEVIQQVVDQALAEAASQPADIDAIAVTRGPGLVGALLVGTTFARGLGLAWQRPIIGVSHIAAHIYAGAMEGEPLPYPWIGLLVSGGHTMLVRADALGCYGNKICQKSRKHPQKVFSKRF